MSKEEKLSLDEVVKNLNKKFGSGAVSNLGNIVSSDYDVIPSGSIGLDYGVLGIGGFARGKMYELMGWESSGKTTLCIHLVAACQRQGLKVAYIDGEQAIDKPYMEALGVNTDELLISQPSNGEEGFEIAIQLLNTGELGLLIIDSDSSLLPRAIIEGEAGEATIGKKARLNSECYPKIKLASSKNNTCVVVTSQFREKIGVLFGNPTTTQGGHALKFYSDCRLEISKTLGKDADKNPFCNITKLKSIKNRMYPPYKTCSFNVVYGRGIDFSQEILDLAVDLGIAKKWGQVITYKEEKYKLDDFINKVSAEDVFREEVKENVIQKFKDARTTWAESIA